MQSLFGIQLPQPYLYIAALAIILVLLAVFGFFLRRVASGYRRIESGGRNRQPRLGIVDTFVIDRQRELLIIRRDDVEHLIMIGGSSDLVIESNIVRHAAAALREPSMSATRTGTPAQAPSTARLAAAGPSPAMADRERPSEPSTRETSPQTPPVITPESILVESGPAFPKVATGPDLTEIVQRFQNAPSRPNQAVTSGPAPASHNETVRRNIAEIVPMRPAEKAVQPEVEQRQISAVDSPSQASSSPVSVTPLDMVATRTQPEVGSASARSIDESLRRLLGRRNETGSEIAQKAMNERVSTTKMT